MFTPLIHRLHWRTEWNVERLVQSARGAGKRVPFRVRACRAVNDPQANLTALRARYRMARAGSPRGNAAVGLAKISRVERHGQLNGPRRPSARGLRCPGLQAA